MTNRDTSIHRFYEGWQVYNERIVEVVGALSEKELGVRPAPEGWPIWATVGHTAGARVYWLCDVFGEPGAETTPFSLSDVERGFGWEDDLDTPRSAAELTEALESTWRIIDDCLDRWTPDMLPERFERRATTQVHTRQSILLRLLSHDAYHAGELSQTLGIHGLPQIDLWRSD
jgi:uncharacterized damage-inducible protein DinB